MSDPLERNIEALVRGAAIRPREAEAKARFLKELAPGARPWALSAVAAILLAATLAAVFRRLDAPPRVDTGARPSTQQPSWIALEPLGADSTIALKARLPNERIRSLKLEGVVDLPDLYILFLMVRAERETFDGRRLRPETKVVHGGFAQVVRGRIALDIPWPAPSPILIKATLDASNQNPEVLASMKGKYPVREWNFRARGWDDALPGRLETGIDEIDAGAAELGALLKEVEAACATEERWKREAPRLLAAARALLVRFENRLPARALFPAAADILLYTARNLVGDSTYFTWKAGVFDGPESYHADKQKLKTFREEAWTFTALRRYAKEASDVAARELALWIVKDLRRAGPKPEHLELAKRTSYADRLREGTNLDALEADIRD